jgi:GDP-4-dehydro-6-deoxy-D-mannose reductase
MITALVIGAAGFTGKALIRRLRGEKVQLWGTGRRSRPGSLDVDGWTTLDIRNRADVERVIAKLQPNWIFNLAGLRNGPDSEVWATNFFGTSNVLSAVLASAPFGRVLLVGSAAEYGSIGVRGTGLRETDLCQPFGAYARSKYLATQTALQIRARSRLRVVVARPFNLVGPGIPQELVVGAVIERIRRALAPNATPIIKIGRLDTERDFLAVDDAVDAYVTLLKCDNAGGVFNVASGVPLPIRTLVTKLLAYAGCPLRLEIDPALIRESEMLSVFGCIDKIRTVGFEPRRSLEAALEEAFWYAIAPQIDEGQEAARRLFKDLLQ